LYQYKSQKENKENRKKLRATTLGKMTLSITTLSKMALITDCCYAGCRAYADCHKQTHYAECHYAECRHAECHGAFCLGI